MIIQPKKTVSLYFFAPLPALREPTFNPKNFNQTVNQKNSNT